MAWHVAYVVSRQHAPTPPLLAPLTAKWKRKKKRSRRYGVAWL
jgi:hypothetical protein